MIKWFCRALVATLACGPAAAETAAPWTLLPDDTLAVIHVDVPALEGSELFRSIMDRQGVDRLPAAADLRSFADATGFDLREDLTTVTIGVGGEPDDPDAPFYLIATGRFEADKITAWAKSNPEVDTGRVGDLLTFRPVTDVSDGPAPIATFLDPRTLVMASAPDFGRLVRSARREGPRAEDLSTLVAEAGGQVIVAMRIPDLAESPADDSGLGRLLGPLRTPAAGPMASLRSILLSLEADRGLAVTLAAAADSPENGALVHQVLEGYLTMGRTMSGGDPELAEILDGLELSREAARVRMSLTLSPDQIDRGLKRGLVSPEADR